MGRVSKSAENRQDEILDVAQRLFFERGYEETPIQAIIEAVGIAKGTFYHHYPSKPAVLDALVARSVRLALATVMPLMEDPSLDPIQRLNQVFLQIGVWKAARREVLLQMHRTLMAPGNAQLLTRIRRNSMEAMVPMLERIIQEGVEKKAFNTAFPRPAARILLELGTVLGQHIGELLLQEHPDISSVRTEIDAFHDAVGRVLGAPAGKVFLVDPSMISTWFPEST